MDRGVLDFRMVACRELARMNSFADDRLGSWLEDMNLGLEVFDFQVL